ncbi:hypothetical protein, partial [Paraburkholderia caribensis]|uniref:hypothetical protein n=1 Tax=Paraburkholderia caribensis TaxID=75105 RepID=UPI0031DB20E4
DVGGPWVNVKNWRCEPLSFAYFSLRRQRKVGAAPHRGDVWSTLTIRGCQRKVKSADASENANTQRTHNQTKNQRPRREGANADPSTKGRKPTAKASRMRIKKPHPIADQKTPANQKHFRYTCRPT